MNEAHRYFAGWQHCDDTVSGGRGSTPDDAVTDFLDNHAVDELDYACLGDGDRMPVQVWRTMSRDEALAKHMAEEWDPDWSFMLDTKIETREFLISITDGDVSFEPTPSCQGILDSCDRAARQAYERDLKERPFYPDGSPRKTWEQLGELERSTWKPKHKAPHP
jgi:hypothetical protein